MRRIVGWLTAAGVLALVLGCWAWQERGNASMAHGVAQEYDIDYAMADAPLVTTPSPFLVAMLQRAHTVAGTARTALDIGSGSGRNTLYLARRGYDVTAVDLSKVGLDLTAEQAHAGRLAVHTVREDINNFDFGERRWDVILLIDFPFPYKALLPKIAAGLKPGGMAIVQDVSIHQPGTVSPDGKLDYTFMDRRDLDAPFAGFSVLHDEEADEPTVWGVRAVMVRFAARKPLAGPATP
ncbi:MAG TPA: class I SAM-dependent methyltransferase [Terriglobales bacterium]|nr:class I SAM-dependent methyltransferase [Terriglobales bacterium]